MVERVTSAGATPASTTQQIKYRQQGSQKDGQPPSFCVEQNMNYKSKRWKKLREKILRRDGYMCQASLRYGRHIEADTVHHVFPASKFPEYQWEPWNLISLCAAEHNAMHIRESDELTDKGMKLQERIAKQNGIAQ